MHPYTLFHFTSLIRLSNRIYLKECVANLFTIPTAYSLALSILNARLYCVYFLALPTPTYFSI